MTAEQVEEIRAEHNKARHRHREASDHYLRNIHFGEMLAIERVASALRLFTLNAELTAARHEECR